MNNRFSAAVLAATALLPAACSKGDQPAAEAKQGPSAAQLAQVCFSKTYPTGTLTLNQSGGIAEVAVRMSKDYITASTEAAPETVKDGILGISAQGLEIVSGARYVDGKVKGYIGGMRGGNISVKADENGIFEGIDTKKVLSDAQACASAPAPAGAE